MYNGDHAGRQLLLTLEAFLIKLINPLLSLEHLE